MQRIADTPERNRAIQRHPVALYTEQPTDRTISRQFEFDLGH
jgi:hypothetical protein